MYRQYSSRVQRKRGIKVKHALRICVLVAVCFWLIYQVKHFHEDSDAKGSMHGGSSGGLIKIRRKDLRSLYHGNLTENQATEEEETTEAVENNLEEVSSTDKKVEEEDEALGDGDGETDEHEVKKVDTKVGQEEDGVDSSAEGEITDHGNGGWQEGFVEDGDRGAKSYSEAGEESYNADEASSAVTRDNHMRTTEHENEVLGISGLHHEKILEQRIKENPGKEAFSGEMKKWLEVDGGGKSEDTIETNVMTSETKENNLNSLEKDSSQNNTLTESHNATLEASNNTTDVATQNPKLSEQNVTRSRPELDHDQIIVTKGTSTEVSNIQAIITLELANHSTLDMEDNQSDSNSTAAKNSESDFEDFSEPSNNTDSFTFRSNHSQLEDGTNTRKNDIMSAESVTSNGTDEVLEAAITGNPEKVHIISTDLSDIQSSDSSLR